MDYSTASAIFMLAPVALVFLYGICLNIDFPYPLMSMSYYAKEGNGGFRRFIRDFFVGYMLPIIMILCLIVGVYCGVKAADEEYAEIKEAISSGYTLYINGVETDVSHITLEDYSLSTITVNDEIREVHIAANK